jgi:ankyrin repeat protein
MNAPVSDLGPPMRAMLFGSDACATNERPTKPETKAIVKLLLERGADVQAADKNGNTAISEAASKGCDRELIRMLIKAGAKINATNVSGLTPFEMGLWSGTMGWRILAAGCRLPPER